ncbi:MAG TPA: sugar phosphate nucleotidyltransferase, partial [Vicinamibacterales bacterium]|nr:sugar phosphate nucleotidyltransferase [Vicinamibacterales bacterium]
MYAVILAGGNGTRLRPLPGTEEPAAFQGTPDGRTLLQQTAARLAGVVDPMDVIVVTNRRHGQLVREQLPEARIVTQPMNRGTATALALVIVSVDRPESETMIVVNADHEVELDDAVQQAITVADQQICGGALGVERPLVAIS